MQITLPCLTLVLFTFPNLQQPATSDSSTGGEKPRVFITDRQSWQMRGAAAGTPGAFGAESHGGARPQTAEIVKTFGQKCPGAVVNNKQEKADYIVVLDHEGGKGLLRHKNKVAVFESESGDSIVSKSTLLLGGSVEEACQAITAHWATHKRGTVAATTPVPASTTAPVATASAPELMTAKARLTVTSIPDGADIEIDGSFVGNTPSSLDLAAGDHTVSVEKAGFRSWERKLKISGGEVSLKAELEKLP